MFSFIAFWRILFETKFAKNFTFSRILVFDQSDFYNYWRWLFRFRRFRHQVAFNHLRSPLERTCSPYIALPRMLSWRRRNITSAVIRIPSMVVWSSLQLRCTRSDPGRSNVCSVIKFTLRDSEVNISLRVM